MNWDLVVVFGWPAVVLAFAVVMLVLTNRQSVPSLPDVEMPAVLEAPAAGAREDNSPDAVFADLRKAMRRAAAEVWPHPLPPDEHARRYKPYRRRLLLIGFSIFFLTTVVVLIGLLPAWGGDARSLTAKLADRNPAWEAILLGGVSAYAAFVLASFFVRNRYVPPLSDHEIEYFYERIDHARRAAREALMRAEAESQLDRVQFDTDDRSRVA